jgi:hypothetical protein
MGAIDLGDILQTQVYTKLSLISLSATRRTTMRSIIAHCMILTPGVANAQSFASGAGAATCAQFAQDYKQDVELERNYFNWAQGFMSGINWKEDTFYHNLDAQTIEDQKAFLRRYCDAHPLEQYILAVQAFYDTLPVRSYSPKHSTPRSR